MEQSVKQRIADIQRGNVPAGYQKTKLGITPADWSTPELNSVLTENKERNRSGRFGKEDVLSVSGEFGVTNQIELLGRSFAGASVKDYHVVETGNIVYTKSPLKENPYGIIKLNKGKAGIVSTLYAVYSCKNNEVGTYLDYYFSLDQNVNNYLRPLVRKGTKNDMKINNEDVLKGCVIFPPESEIAKIVEILGCCDRVITLKKELIAEKKKQKKALMQKLLNPDSGFCLPGFSGEWKSVMLSECVTLGKVKISPADCDKSCKCIELEHIAVESGKLLGHCSPERVQSLKTVFHKNDILFGKLRPYLKKIILAPFDGICCSECWVLKVAYNINPAFLYNRLFMDDFISASCTVSGTKMPRADWQYVKDFQLFIPEITEQQAIADILSAADKEIDLLEQELAQQEQKKKSLMQLLLTGIVRV